MATCSADQGSRGGNGDTLQFHVPGSPDRRIDTAVSIPAKTAERAIYGGAIDVGTIAVAGGVRSNELDADNRTCGSSENSMGAYEYDAHSGSRAWGGKG